MGITPVKKEFPYEKTDPSAAIYLFINPKFGKIGGKLTLTLKSALSISRP
jgi:hypothetical protein